MFLRCGDMPPEERSRKVFHVQLLLLETKFQNAQIYMELVGRELSTLMKDGVLVTPIIRLPDGSLNRMEPHLHYPVLNTFIADSVARQEVANIMMGAGATHVCQWCCLPGSFLQTPAGVVVKGMFYKMHVCIESIKFLLYLTSFVRTLFLFFKDF
jgi:hypothetical protein